MRLVVRAVVASFLACVALPAPAQQRADAVLLVNSLSPSYGDAELHVRPYLDHLGVPYTVVDVATTHVGAELGDYALIIVGHPSLDTTGAHLDASAQQALVNAVSLGTGLVNFDHDLASNRTGRYAYVQQIFGFGYGWATSGEGVVFTGDAPNHYISTWHAANSTFGLAQVPSPSLQADGSSTVLARFQDSNDPFLVVKSYGLGRAVQWGSSAWMSPPQHRGSLKGPMRGIDDLVWRGLAWAARKPFVMQGLPNFLTMRVDDVEGPLTWAHVANEFGIKPWMGVFYDKLSGTDSIDIAHLTNGGHATAAVHSAASAPFYFDHFSAADWPDATLANHFAAATTWHDSYNIPVSKVVVPHFYEIGTNAFPYLASWGVRSIATHMTPGTTYSDTAPWLTLGPYRLHEAGLANTAAPMTYADYLPIPNHPELAGRFFNCVTEIRDDAGYEWTPASTDVQGTIDRGTRQTVRAFNAMALATLFTHEYYLQPFATADWRSVLGQIMSNLAPYSPELVTLDYACEYLRAKHDTRITAAVYDPSTQTLRTTVSGRADVATRFLVFTEAGGFVHQGSQTVDPFDATTTVDRTISGESVPSLVSITVTPANPAIYVGATRQLAATARYSDGSSLDVTGMATWTSGSTGVVTVSGAGLASAVAAGTAVVTATVSGVSGTTTITTSVAPLQVTTASLQAATQTVPYSASLAAIGGVAPYAWSVTAGSLPAGLTLSSGGTLSGRPTGSGDATFTVTATDSAQATASASLTLTVAPFSSGTLWPASAVPNNPDRGPDAAGPIELGVKFRSDVSGWITALRFYKSALNTGVHTGNLWSSAGDTLTSAVFSGETASGWQQVWLVDPVAVDSNTLYVASYHNATGHYAYDFGYFTDAGQDRAPLHAPRSADVGGNGVFTYSTSSVFPTETSLDSNYWVDVVFTPTDPGTLTSLAITPTPATLELNATAQLSASGTFADGVHDVSGQVLWQSTNPAVATVSFLGLVTPQGAGTTTIRATAGAVSASFTLTVLGPLASVVVSPASARLVAGGTQQFTAAGYDALGSPKPGLTFTWSATGGGAVTQGGLFTAGAAAGTFTGNVVATSGTIQGSASTETVALSSVSISPASVPGGTAATGTVTLSAAAPASGAQVALSSDTAGVTVPASVTVASGATTASFTVDTTATASAASATITGTLGGSATATLSVTAPAASSISFPSATVVGGVTTTGTVQLDGPAPANGAVVTLSSSASAAAVPASLTVAAGATSATFDVTTSPVAAGVAATISASAAGGSTTTVLTIAAPTPASVSISPASLAGGAGATGTVTLSGVAAAPVVVSLASSDPSATVPASVTVAAGASSATFSVGTTPVAQAVTAVVTATVGGTASTANLTVRPPAVSSLRLDVSIVAGGSGTTGTVTLASAAPAGGATVQLSSSSAAVTVPATVTISAGQVTSASFAVSTTPVAAQTTATLTASFQGSTQTTTLAVAPPSVGLVVVSPASVVGGTAATASVQLTTPAPAGGTVVTLSSDSAAASAPASVTVAAGSRAVSFAVTTTAVAATVTVTLSASAPTGSARTATLAVTPPGLSSVAVSPTVVPGSTAATGTVTLQGLAPAGGLVVSLSDDSGAASVPASVTVAEGSQTGTFTIPTSPVATNTRVTVSATLAGVTRTARFTVARPAVAGLTLTPSSVVGGGASTGRVVLTSAAPAAGAVVQVLTTAPAGLQATTVTVPGGSLTATFTVSTTPVAATATPVVYATGGGLTKTATLTVTPPAVATLSLSPTSVPGGASSTATLTLSGAAPATGAVVTLSSSSLAASPPASVTVPAGATSTTFAVPTAIVGSSTTATITASAAGGSATATLTIRGITVTGLVIDPTSVVGGGTLSATVTLSNLAPTGGYTVRVLSSDASVTPPATVTVPAGEATLTFAIPTAAVASATAVTVYATGGNATATSAVTVNPAAP